MLVLTRKLGQSIIINDNIEVTILDVKGDSVRLGVEAPKNVTIYRHEIYEEIKKENLKTAQQSSLEDITMAMDMFKTYGSDKKQDYKKVRRSQSLIQQIPHNRT